jgi:hypothetical protein
VLKAVLTQTVVNDFAKRVLFHRSQMGRASKPTKCEEGREGGTRAWAPLEDAARTRIIRFNRRALEAHC